MQPQDSKIQQLEAELESVKIQLRDLQQSTRSGFDDFRKQSIDTLSSLPDKLADAEQKVLAKQSLILTIATLAFTAISIFAGFFINSLVNQTFSRVEEINKLNQESVQLISELRNSPDLAYQRLRHEELLADLEVLKLRPDFIRVVYGKFFTAKILPDETFEFFRAQALDESGKISYDDKQPYIDLLVARFSDRILRSGDGKLLNLISNAGFFLPDSDSSTARKIREMIKESSNQQVRDILLDQFLHNIVGNIVRGTSREDYPETRLALLSIPRELIDSLQEPQKSQVEKDLKTLREQK